MGVQESLEYPHNSEIQKIQDDNHIDHQGIYAMQASIRQMYFGTICTRISKNT